jgi:hypothetical protein
MDDAKGLLIVALIYGFYKLVQAFINGFKSKKYMKNEGYKFCSKSIEEKGLEDSREVVFAYNYDKGEYCNSYIKGWMQRIQQEEK